MCHKNVVFYCVHAIIPCPMKEGGINWAYHRPLMPAYVALYIRFGMSGPFWALCFSWRIVDSRTYRFWLRSRIPIRVGLSIFSACFAIFPSFIFIFPRSIIPMIELYCISTLRHWGGRVSKGVYSRKGWMMPSRRPETSIFPPYFVFCQAYLTKNGL